MKILWETDRWDGPLRGIAWHDGALRYYDCIDLDAYPRVYQLRKLTILQLVDAAIRHAIFVVWVKWIRYGWRGFYRCFPPKSAPRYKDGPVVGTVTH